MVKLSYVLTIYTAWCFQGDNFIYLQSIASIGNIWQSYVQMNSEYFLMKGDVNHTVNVLSAKSTDECLRTKSQDN